MEAEVEDKGNREEFSTKTKFFIWGIKDMGVAEFLEKVWLVGRGGWKG